MKTENEINRMRQTTPVSSVFSHLLHPFPVFFPIFSARFECGFQIFSTRFECGFRSEYRSQIISHDQEVSKLQQMLAELKTNNDEEIILTRYGNLRSYWTTTKLWKPTVVLDYYEAMETYSRIGLLRSHGN